MFSNLQWAETRCFIPTTF